MDCIEMARKVVQSPLWEQGGLTLQVWLWLLAHAVREAEGRDVEGGLHLERGQLLTSYTEIARGCQFRAGNGLKVPSRSTIRGIIDRLSLGWLTVRSVSRPGGNDSLGLLITVSTPA